jgi:hypothetical protein
MSDVTKRTNIRLSMQEDFALTKWLHAHEMKPGEQIGDLVKQVRIDLKIDKINYNHVQTRLQEFGLKLIPAPEKDQNKRLDRMERFVLEIGAELGKLGCAFSPDLVEFLNARE